MKQQTTIKQQSPKTERAMPQATERNDSPSELDMKLRISKHAVYRVFAKETVVLNLETATYHGLNRTAGRILEVLERAACVREAIPLLAREYGLPAQDIERDVLELIQKLRQRKLIELSNNESRPPEPKV
jgi:hypothetical protein